MKKVISVLLSVIAFLGGIVCPKISAGGVDKEVYLIYAQVWRLLQYL